MPRPKRNPISRFRFVATVLVCWLPIFATLRAAGDDLAWMRGVNYVPSYAKNDIAIWLDYDAAVVDRELGFAQQLGLNTVRVFLNQAVYERQPAQFLAKFEGFLKLCDHHQLKLMPVLFDSCFDPQTVDLASYRDKNWMPSPGFGRLGLADWPAMEQYIGAVVGHHRKDSRIVMWDVMNEPESTSEFGNPTGRSNIVTFVRRAVRRVRQERPIQSLGVGWAGTEQITYAADLADVLVIHNYSDPEHLAADIRKTQALGRKLGKPVIINEFVGRPRQPIELALPVVASEHIGWCFWELMIGRTQFSQGRIPYQGHIYPDGTCFSAKEVAAILFPAGPAGSAAALATQAGFKVSARAPTPFSEAGMEFSSHWEPWHGTGPAGGRLWFAAEGGESVTKDVVGRSVVLVLKHGPDCGIATVVIDGQPAGKREIDTYAPEVDWNVATCISTNLAQGRHQVVLTAAGRKTAASSNTYLQVVDILGR